MGEKINTQKTLSPSDLQALKDEVDILSREHQNEYDKKSIVINKAIQDIGMGKYTWNLFFLCGIGWFADNLWLQQVGLTLQSISGEFGISDDHVRYTSCYLFVGLCIGAVFWGIVSDIMGRKFAFNMTLLIASIAGLFVGAAPSWLSICWLYSAVGFGVGGNLPIGSALFLEFLPKESGHLLTLLSVWWPIGQLVAAFSGWGFMGGNYAPEKGWRYSCYAMGATTFVLFLGQFLFFHLFESPKFLLSKGRQSEAVTVVVGIAGRNGTSTWLTENLLDEIGGYPEADHLHLTFNEIIRRKLNHYSKKRFARLFATKEVGWNTAMLWFSWFAIGLGYPLVDDFLPQFLTSGQGSSGDPISDYTLHRNFVIITVISIAGSLIACYTVSIRRVGRRGTMIVSTFMAGILLIVFTLSHHHMFQMGISAAQEFFLNATYAVLFAYTSEVFSAPIRCTGSGISEFLNRIGGLSAVIFAANLPSSNSKNNIPNDPTLPALISGAFIVAAFLAMMFLSIETRGRHKL